MSLNKLFYNQIAFTMDGNMITASPNFLCPVCGGRPQHRFNEEFRFNVNKTFDFNGQRTFTMPCCSTAITLNIAVYKAKGELPKLRVCVPESVIPVDWWEAPIDGDVVQG